MCGPLASKDWELTVYLPRSLRLVRQSLSEDAEEGLLLLVRASQDQLPVTLWILQNLEESHMCCTPCIWQLNFVLNLIWLGITQKTPRGMAVRPSLESFNWAGKTHTDNAIPTEPGKPIQTTLSHGLRGPDWMQSGREEASWALEPPQSGLSLLTPWNRPLRASASLTDPPWWTESPQLWAESLLPFFKPSLSGRLSQNEEGR